MFVGGFVLGNVFQKLIYNTANAVPLLILTAITYYIQIKTVIVPIILLFISVLIVTIFFKMFFSGQKKWSTKTIRVTSISSKDSWVVAYIIGYLMPFTYLVISDYSIVALIVIVVMLLLVFIPAIMALPNILLFCAKYHFYEIGTDDTGVNDYILISKRKIRNKKDIKSVKRVFEKLLIDSNGGV